MYSCSQNPVIQKLNYDLTLCFYLLKPMNQRPIIDSAGTFVNLIFTISATFDMKLRTDNMD